MSRALPTTDAETVLEVGFLLMATGCLAGLAALLTGRAFDAIERARVQAEPVPERGSVPFDRHHHTTGVSAR